jgi:hypothetical protein
MNKLDRVSESLEKICWFKILKFFEADPESGIEQFRVRDGKNLDPGSATRSVSPALIIFLLSLLSSLFGIVGVQGEFW